VFVGGEKKMHKSILSRWIPYTCIAFAGVIVHQAGASPVTTLELQYPSAGITILDNGAGDSDPTVGRIINSSTIAGVGVTINVANSNSPGSPSGGELQISDLTLQNGNASPASLTIQVSDINFTQPGSPGSPMLLTSSAGGTFTHSVVGVDTVQFTSFADPLNGQPAGPVSTLPLTFTKSTGLDPESFSGNDATAWVRGAGAYSLTNLTTISNLASGATLNFSGSTLATPEPTMLAAGLAIGLGLLARHRKT
jgi:hypothetical protein